MAGRNTDFTSRVAVETVGTQDVDKLIGAFDRLSGSVENVGTKSRTINQHPGFDDFAAKIKSGIQNPMQGAGDAVQGMLTKLGPMGVAIGGTGAALLAGGIVAAGYARELGNLGDEIEDTAVRMGLTTRETQEFRLAMKFAGGDMAQLEATTRKFSQEVEAGGGNLRKFGVEIYDVGTGKVRPTSAIMLEFSGRLQGMTDVAHRNAAAITVMGRGALEVLPDFLALGASLEKAKAVGTIWSDRDLAQFDKAHEAMVRIDAQWDFMVLKLKQGIVIPFVWAFGGQNERSFFERGGPKYPRASPGGDDPQVAEFLAKRLLGTAAAPDQSGTIARNDARFALLRAETDEERLGVERGKLGELFKKFVPGAPSAGNAGALDEIAAQRAVVAAIERRIEATKKLKEVLTEFDSFVRQNTAKDLGPVLSIFAQRDRLVAGGAPGSAATDAALTGAGAELAKQVAAGNTLLDRRLRYTIDSSDAGGIVGDEYSTSPQIWEARQKSSEWFAAQLNEELEGFERGVDQWVHGFLGAIQPIQAATRAIAGIEHGADRERQGLLTERGVRLAELSAGPGQEVGLAGTRLQWRLDLAERLYESGKKHAQELLDVNEQAVALKAVEAEHSNRLYEAAIGYELRIAELQRERLDHLREGAGEFFDAALKGPAGLKQFGNQLVLGEARKVFQNVITETFGGVSANLGLKGKIFQGTLLGVDPLKDTAALKLDTAGVRLSVAAGELMNAARALAVSPSGGGGGFGGGGFSFPGVGGGSGGVGGGDFLSDDFGVYGDLAGGGPKGKGGFNFGKAIGYAGAAAGAGFGIYSGIRQGGLRGAATGLAAALGGAAIIPGPQQPFLAGAALATSLLTQFFPDPKRERDQQIDQTLAGARYTAPAAWNYQMDRQGRGFDYGGDGSVRPIEVRVVLADEFNNVLARSTAKVLEERNHPRLNAAVRAVARI